MSTETRISPRYARAILLLAKEKGQLEALKNDAEFVLETCQKSRDLSLLLKSPVVSSVSKIKTLERVFSTHLSDMMQHLITILCRKEREYLLKSVVENILHQYNELQGIQEASLVTAVELAPAELTRFEKLVTLHSQMPKVALKTKINKDIIGGFVLNIGDRQIDESVRTKLKDLAIQFAK